MWPWSENSRAFCKLPRYITLFLILKPSQFNFSGGVTAASIDFPSLCFSLSLLLCLLLDYLIIN